MATQAPQVHAQEAGAALKLREAAVVKPSHAKVAYTGPQVRIIVTDDVANHFPEFINVKFNQTLYPGKLVVEIRKDPKGTARFTPLRTGARHTQVMAGRVEGCGETFPKFGMTQPDQVRLGTDGVLRIILPKNRNPVVSPAKKTKLAKPRGKAPPVPVPAKEPEVKKKEEAKVPTEETRTMHYKDTMVSFSASRFEVRAGRELAKFLDGHRYVLADMILSDDGQTARATIQTDAHGNILGTSTVGRDKSLRVLSLQKLPRGVQKVPFFGPMQAHEVEVLDEGLQVIITMKAPFPPQGATAGRKQTRGKRRVAPHEARGSGTLEQHEESPLAKLRRLRDEVNRCVDEAKEQGDTLRLSVKDNGHLGFVYEG